MTEQAMAARLTAIERCETHWTEGHDTDPCGCGTHDVKHYRDTVYHYDGKHWIAICLAKHLRAHVETLTQQVAKAEQQRDAAHAALERELDKRCRAIAGTTRCELVKGHTGFHSPAVQGYAYSTYTEECWVMPAPAQETERGR